MQLLNIVIPVYNAENYLPQCLESLVNQTYHKKEIILIDDGSSDSSPEICDEYANKHPFIHVIHKENSGVSAARNTALDLIRGGYVVFADADDAVDLDAYEVMIKEMEDTDSDVSACNLQNEYGAFQVRKNNFEHGSVSAYSGDEELVKAFFCQIGGWAGNKIYRREVIGDVRFREDISQAEDTLFAWEVMKRAKKVCYINLPFYHYRYMLSSSSHAANTKKLKTAITVWDLIKLDLDNVHVEEEILQKWTQNYIVWNLKICESMIGLHQPDKKYYHLAKRNISNYKGYIPYMSRRYRLLANSLLKSWDLYKLWARLFYILKKTYVRIKIKG